MEFLILRGHNRLIPQGGLTEFPDAILNGKRLDLYNLYKEVSYWNCVLWEWLCFFFLHIFLSQIVGLFRWLPGEDFMLAMASTGRDKSFQRCAITPQPIEWLYVLCLGYISTLSSWFLCICYIGPGIPL